MLKSGTGTLLWYNPLPFRAEIVPESFTAHNKILNFMFLDTYCSELVKQPSLARPALVSNLLRWVFWLKSLSHLTQVKRNMYEWIAFNNLVATDH